jgi:hypothetical protein
MLVRSVLPPCEYLVTRMRVTQAQRLQSISSRHHNAAADSIARSFQQVLEAPMVNAIVACFVVLTLAALYFLAKMPEPRSQPSRRRSGGRMQRLLRIAIRRAAHRYER